MLCPFTASAEETNENFFTLDELLQMSDDEYLEKYYSEVSFDEYTERFKYLMKKNHLTTFDGSMGWCMIDDKDFETYVPNFTEKKLEKLLGDSIEYSYTTPIYFDLEQDFLWTKHTFSLEIPALNGAEINQENLILYSKIRRCASQVLHGKDWLSLYAPLGTADDERKKVSLGDINIDGTMDIYDAIWIASDLINIIDLTDSQKKAGDVNGDNACDLYDAIEIAKTQL